MQAASLPPSSDPVCARTVLEYWLERLPRSPQVVGGRVSAMHRSRSLVRLPRRFGYEAVLIHWPPGSAAPPHDHGRAGSVVGVLHGTLQEFVHNASGRVRVKRKWLPGEVIEVPAKECHEVRNSSRATAATVHVYETWVDPITLYQRTAAGQLEPATATFVSAPDDAETSEVILAAPRE